jgi:ribose/xylose/arabinose/galactoside ABC-type transport system permease subunit
MNATRKGYIEVDPRMMQRSVILLVFAGMCLALSLLSPHFLNGVNISNVLQQISTLVIAACGATFVMISGGVDLSVGGVMALSGVLSAGFAAAGSPLPVCFLLGILGGTLVGALNGVLVAGARIIPIIATLGTMWVARGLAFIYTASQTEGALSIVIGVPRSYRILGRSSLGPFPIIVLITAAVYLISFIALRYTVFGLHTYAVGCNDDASRRFGVRTGRQKLLIYVLAGALAGISGVLLSSRLGSGEPNTGLGFEFEVVVAVLLGGTSLLGGEGSLFGTLIGALFVGVLSNGLNLLGVQTFYRYVVLGSVLVLAVVIDTNLKNRNIKTLKIRTPFARIKSTDAMSGGMP